MKVLGIELKGKALGSLLSITKGKKGKGKGNKRGRQGGPLAPRGLGPSAHCPASTVSLPAANGLALPASFLWSVPLVAAQHVKLSGNRGPAQQLSMSPFSECWGPPWAVGKSPGMGWHRPSAASEHTHGWCCKTALCLLACMRPSFLHFPVLLQYHEHAMILRGQDLEF